MSQALDTDEFKHVSNIFLSEPIVPPHYYRGLCDSWSKQWSILSIERVENKGLEGKVRHIQ